jgi:hypothetical protein
MVRQIVVVPAACAAGGASAKAFAQGGKGGRR